jgi:hypothetical protein
MALRVKQFKEQQIQNYQKQIQENQKLLAQVSDWVKYTERQTGVGHSIIIYMTIAHEIEC